MQSLSTCSYNMGDDVYRSIEKQLLREVSYGFALGQIPATVVRLPLASLLIFSRATPTLSHDGEETPVVMGKPWVKPLGV